MREIKFRAWHPKEGMLYPKELRKLNLNLTFEGHVLYNNFVDETLKWNLMQYTGLKDKNGKEIYHGDLLMFKNPDSESFYEGFAVVTETETLGYDFQPIPSLTIEDIFMHGYDSSMFWHDFDNDVEIIGNIYENPELLNGLR